MRIKNLILLILFFLGIKSNAEVRGLSLEKINGGNSIKQSVKINSYKKPYPTQRDGFVENKNDSLIQKSIINKLKGTWKLAQNNDSGSTNIIFSDYIVFTDKRIKFYNQKKKLKSSKLIFEPIKNNFFEDTMGLKFGENEIWTLDFREINNELRLVWNRKIDKDGNLRIRTDDRQIIKDPIKRQKALEGEIHTYYIKIK